MCGALRLEHARLTVRTAPRRCRPISRARRSVVQRKAETDGEAAHRQVVCAKSHAHVKLYPAIAPVRFVTNDDTNPDDTRRYLADWRPRPGLKNQPRYVGFADAATRSECPASALTRTRSPVRTQHRPLRKSGILQVKRSTSERAGIRFAALMLQPEQRCPYDSATSIASAAESCISGSTCE